MTPPDLIRHPLTRPMAALVMLLVIAGCASAPSYKTAKYCNAEGDVCVSTIMDVVP